MNAFRSTMQFQGEKSPSTGPKFAIAIWYILAICAGIWYSFFGTGAAASSGNVWRQAIIIACFVIYIARASVTLFVFVKRKIPWWETAWGGGLIGIFLYLFLYEGLISPRPLGYVDLLGVLLYIVGSYIGTASEYTRHVWKNRPENQGHLYTEGLFRYSRHINYFGDLLLFTGIAILTTELWAGFVPLGMALNFVFIIIPAHDVYLASRYGIEFEEYAKRAKRLIPFIY